MPKAPKSKKVAPVPTPYDAPKKEAESKSGPIFEKKPKNFSVGGDIRPKMDMGRFVAWPKYVRLQRQRKILYERLKVPPAINQFKFTMDKQQATEFFKLAAKYKPETKAEKKERTKDLAAKEVDTSEAATSKKANCLKYGINHITSLVEQKKATLVVIAHDVDPIELVVWLPALCRKMDVPYAIVKGKSRLGQLVHKKTATAVAFTSVGADDRKAFSALVQSVKETNAESGDKMRKLWGGNIMGPKSQAATRKRDKALEREAQKKAMAQF
mmetsp:Transcript_18262/g.49136  ORF Transcript_18262/g.49136 Transcript_18262/m.49136 type:complete len:270 (-) Transcript_18262:446-1255(-)